MWGRDRRTMCRKSSAVAVCRSQFSLSRMILSILRISDGEQPQLLEAASSLREGTHCKTHTWTCMSVNDLLTLHGEHICVQGCSGSPHPPRRSWQTGRSRRWRCSAGTLDGPVGRPAPLFKSLNGYSPFSNRRCNPPHTHSYQEFISDVHGVTWDATVTKSLPTSSLLWGAKKASVASNIKVSEEHFFKKYKPASAHVIGDSWAYTPIPVPTTYRVRVQRRTHIVSVTSQTGELYSMSWN